MSTRVSVGAVCHLGVGAGHGGRQKNEDNLLVCADHAASWWEEGRGITPRPQEGSGVLLAVCDGLGGHANGEVASAAAVRVMAKLYQPNPPKNPMRALLTYVQEAHRSLHRAAAQQGPVTMGTTLTAAWILGAQVHWVHVGDSRLYLARAGRIYQLSSDQTRNEFARRDHQPASPNGDLLAQSFIYGSRGLGNDQALRLDKGLDAGTEALEQGDLLLLCSDGVHGVLPEATLTKVLHRAATPQAIAEELLAAAMAVPSRDNLSAVVARIDEVPPRQDEWEEDPDVTVQF